MSGTLVRRGDAWQLRVYAGKGKTVTRTFRGTEREARRALAKFAAQVHEGRETHSRGRTVASLLDAWYDARSGSWSEKNVDEHRRIIDRTLKPALGPVPLARLSTADVDRFYGDLRRTVSAGRVKRIHSVFRSALQQGVRWGWLGVNPAAAATLPKADRPPIRPPSTDELRRLLDVCEREEPDYFVYVHLAGASGARRGELLRLRWGDVDLEAGEMIVRRGKTQAATRRLALDNITLSLLERLRGLQQARAEVCVTKMIRNPFVFSWEPDGSKPWRGDSVTHAFGRIRRKAGVTGVRLHDLRHYVATRLITAGVDIRTVAGRLGHASPSTTLSVYSHFQPAADRAAAELLSQLLAENQDNPDYNP